MKRNFIAAAVASVMLAAGATGCTSTGALDPTQIDPIIAQVQQTTAQLCKFVPTVGTVASIVASLVPGGSAATTIATQVAESICSAIAASPAASSHRRLAAGEPGVPMVAGVPIQGYFLK